MPFNFSSLPIEMRTKILRKINSKNLRSLHHVQAGSQASKKLTNARGQLAYRRKLTAKAEEMYRTRLRKAFATAIQALEYFKYFRDPKEAESKLHTRGGWKIIIGDWWDMTKTNKDGFDFRLCYAEGEDRFEEEAILMKARGEKALVRISSPMGLGDYGEGDWEFMLSDRNHVIYYEYLGSKHVANSGYTPKMKIERSIGEKVLKNEFRIEQRRW